MLIGVVSDTHNNHKNIKNIIEIFNKRRVDLVIHTGDITNASSLEKFSSLNSSLFGVYGNNDRDESGLEEIVEKNFFEFQNPPFELLKKNKKIVIFHEPDLIKDYLSKNNDVDLVLHGHTHRYRKEILNNALVFNPGESAGMVRGKNAIGIVELENLNIELIFF